MVKSKTAGAVASLIVAVLVVAGLYLVMDANEYDAKFLVPSAAQLAKGSPVLIRGFQVGNVSKLSVQDGKAVVEVKISGDDVPLHDGTTTMVEWSAALGERLLEIFPGPKSNAEIPSGGLITAPSRQIEVDQVLSALDAPTRAHVDTLLQQLNSTFQGNDQDLQATLKSAGPTVQALGDVLSAVGQDGPAIKALVGQLHNLVATAVSRQNQLRGTVDNLAGLTSSAASQQQQFADGLSELPSTLRTAQVTLNKVHPATDATVPLLHDLRPGVERLVGVSRDLSPLMHDLRPAAERLRPTMESLRDLLGRTPGLLDSTHDDLPTITDILRDYQPAASFIRPYTPELAGFLSNWGTAFGSYDSQGHYWPALFSGEGYDSLSDSVVRLPAQSVRAEPKPGEDAGKPWNDPDATGSEPR
jgi:phospholipid/cholesterol/gamma-HCH transport system substrate-binding protein